MVQPHPHSAVLLVLGTLAALAMAGDIPGVTRPTSAPTATRVLADIHAQSLQDINERCGSDQPDSCPAINRQLAMQQRDDHLQFEKRQEPSSRVVDVPQNAPNGGLSMTQPPITAQATVC